jgi:hypothetical protein
LTKRTFRQKSDLYIASPVAELWKHVQIAKLHSVVVIGPTSNRRSCYAAARWADAFVIARAACEDRTVVTGEVIKPNAVKIPNICAHFGVSTARQRRCGLGLEA